MAINLLPVHLGLWLVSSKLTASIIFMLVYTASVACGFQFFVVAGNFSRGSRKRNCAANPVLHLKLDVLINLLKHFHP
jgi:hypothetical protein